MQRTSVIAKLIFVQPQIENHQCPRRGWWADCEHLPTAPKKTFAALVTRAPFLC